MPFPALAALAPYAVPAAISAAGAVAGHFLKNNNKNDQRTPRFTPQNTQALNQLIGQLQKTPTSFAPIADKARYDFQTETVPSLMNAYGSNDRGSGALFNRLSSGGADLQKTLAALESQHNVSQQDLLSRLLTTPQSDAYQQDQAPGLLESLISKLTPELSKQSGNYFQSRLDQGGDKDFGLAQKFSQMQNNNQSQSQPQERQQVLGGVSSTANNATSSNNAQQFSLQDILQLLSQSHFPQGLSQPTQQSYGSANQSQQSPGSANQISLQDILSMLSQSKFA
jgi:hypothetical protein